MAMEEAATLDALWERTDWTYMAALPEMLRDKQTWTEQETNPYFANGLREWQWETNKHRSRRRRKNSSPTVVYER